MHNRVFSDDARIIISIFDGNETAVTLFQKSETAAPGGKLLFREVSFFFILSFSHFTVKLFLIPAVISPY